MRILGNFALTHFSVINRIIYDRKPLLDPIHLFLPAYELTLEKLGLNSMKNGWLKNLVIIYYNSYIMSSVK